MKDAFMMSREELLAKTGTDSEKGLNPESIISWSVLASLLQSHCLL